MWMKARASFPVVLLVVAGAAAITFWTTTATIAQSGGAPGNCACVAVVDLPSVMDGLAQRAEAQVRLEQMAQEMKDQDAQFQQSLQDKKAGIDARPAGDPALRALQEAIALEALEYQSWRAFANERLDIEKSIMLRDLHRKMSKAIDELAVANGYDLVLMNDSGASLGINPDAQVSRENQIRQQITARRIMHASPRVDITRDLIERMNNAFNAGG